MGRMFTLITLVSAAGIVGSYLGFQQRLTSLDRQMSELSSPFVDLDESGPMTADRSATPLIPVPGSMLRQFAELDPARTPGISPMPGFARALGAPRPWGDSQRADSFAPHAPVDLPAQSQQEDLEPETPEGYARRPMSRLVPDAPLRQGQLGIAQSPRIIIFWRGTATAAETLKDVRPEAPAPIGG